MNAHHLQKCLSIESVGTQQSSFQIGTPPIALSPISVSPIFAHSFLGIRTSATGPLLRHRVNGTERDIEAQGCVGTNEASSGQQEIVLLAPMFTTSKRAL